MAGKLASADASLRKSFRVPQTSNGEVEKLGGKRWDTSSLLARLEK